MHLLNLSDYESPFSISAFINILRNALKEIPSYTIVIV